MTGWSFLLLQGVLAATGLLILVRRVFPTLKRASRETGAFVADVWAPIAVVLSMLIVAGKIGPSVAGPGWVPVGGPTCVGVFALAAGLWCRPRHAASGFDGRGRLSLAAVAVGLLLLLLSGAYELTIWTGQCAFAMGALVLWINTPPPVPVETRLGDEPSGPDGARARPGPWLAIALLCAAGQGGAALVTIDRLPTASAWLLVGYAVLAAISAVVAGGSWAIRVGGWAAVLGTLFGLGTLSLVKLAPMSLDVFRGAGVSRNLFVADGFGRYAAEAVLLMVFPVAAFVVPSEYRRLCRPMAALLLVVGVILTTFRLLAV